MSSNRTERAEFIAGLRAFADLIESDPLIPSPKSADLWAFIQEHNTGLAQDERYAIVHDFADAHDVAVTEDYKGDRSADKRFGPVLLRVVAFADKKPEARTVTRPHTRQTAPIAA